MVPAELCLLCRVWNQKQVAVKTKTSALDCGALCVERSTLLQLRFFLLYTAEMCSTVCRLSEVLVGDCGCCCGWFSAWNSPSSLVTLLMALIRTALETVGGATGGATGATATTAAGELPIRLSPSRPEFRLVRPVTAVALSGACCGCFDGPIVKQSRSAKREKKDKTIKMRATNIKGLAECHEIRS